ncbi:MAG TPA: WD40 repeat domain-containing protein, partial [Flavobacteriales bacterium]|nr:WD40 repeat domain-containing protein [Flavobacteriales bacterium]
VKAWSLDSLDALDKLKLPHTRSVNAMALGGPGGAHLATGSDDRSIKVWAL